MASVVWSNLENNWFLLVSGKQNNNIAIKGTCTKLDLINIFSFVFPVKWSLFKTWFETLIKVLLNITWWDSRQYSGIWTKFILSKFKDAYAYRRKILSAGYFDSDCTWSSAMWLKVLENPALGQSDYKIRVLNNIRFFNIWSHIYYSNTGRHKKVYTLQTIQQTNHSHSELYVYNNRQETLQNIVSNDPSFNF